MRASFSEVDKIVELLRKAHKADPNTSDFAEKKVRFLLEEAITNPKFLILINKEVTAILVWVVVPTFFSYKKNISEIVFYSERAGSGFRLLKESEEWLDQWGDSIEAINLSTSSDNEKVDEMISRLGNWNKVGSCFVRGDK